MEGNKILQKLLENMKIESKTVGERGLKINLGGKEWLIQILAIND